MSMKNIKTKGLCLFFLGYRNTENQIKIEAKNNMNKYKLNAQKKQQKQNQKKRNTKAKKKNFYKKLNG